MTPLLLPMVWADRSIAARAAPHIYAVPSEVPNREFAIVLGAGLYDDGVPTAALEDRLAGAVELWRRGRVQRILASGAGETPTMVFWLEQAGVPAEYVDEDPFGYRTLLTMKRARWRYDIRSAVVCTNEFHLARSVYLGRRAGIDAVGYVVDRRRYRFPVRNRAREFVARNRAVVDVHLLRQLDRPKR